MHTIVQVVSDISTKSQKYLNKMQLTVYVNFLFLKKYQYSPFFHSVTSVIIKAICTNVSVICGTLIRDFV